MKTIMIAFREESQNGGPYNSHLRIMNSRLKEKYHFVPLIVPKGKMGLFNIKIIKSLVMQIRKTKPDAVQIIGLEMIGFYLALSCKIAGVEKIILAIHGSTTEAIAFNKNRVKKFIMERLEIFTIKSAYCTFGVSKYVKTIKNVEKYSKKYYGEIYNMLIESSECYDRQMVEKELNIQHKKIVVVSTGRLTQEKGFDVLTEIIKHYKNNSSMVFVIAGEGIYKPIMEHELAEQINSGQVKLLGYRNDIAKILSAGDIFVMASYHETLCMSLMEAGQSGLALLASNVGGMREIVMENQNGYLIEPGDISGYIKKLDFLIENKEKLNQMKRSAKEIIHQNFSNSISIQKLDELYLSVVGD